MLTRVRAKGQITIPDTVRRAAHIEVGDYLEMTVQGDTVVLRPRVVVPKSQAWFWTSDWQAGEREATEEIAAGRTTQFESDAALLDSLD